MVTTLLLSIIFTATILGKGIALVSLGLLFLYAIYQLIKQPKLRAVWTEAMTSPFAIAVGVTLLLWLIASLCGIASGRAVRGWFGVAGLTLSAVTVYPLVRRLTLKQYQDISRMVSWGLLAAIVIFFVMYSGVLTVLNEMVSDSKKLDRSVLRVYSSLFAIALPFVWMYTLDRKSRKGYVVAMAISMVAIVGIVLAAGRSGWVAMLGSFAVFVVLYPWRKSAVSYWRRVVHVVHLPIAACIGYWVLKSSVAAKSLSERLIISTDAGTGMRRMEIWQISWENILQHPWLGIGVKGYRHIDFTGSRAVQAHPHNMFIEILLETGALGLLAFVIAVTALLLPPLWRVMCCEKKQAKENAVQATIFASLAAYGIAAQLHTAFFHLWWTTFFAVLVMMVVAVDRGLLRQKA